MSLFKDSRMLMVQSSHLIHNLDHSLTKVTKSCRVENTRGFSSNLLSHGVFAIQFAIQADLNKIWCFLEPKDEYLSFKGYLFCKIPSTSAQVPVPYQMLMGHVGNYLVMQDRLDLQSCLIQCLLKPYSEITTKCHNLFVESGSKKFCLLEFHLGYLKTKLNSLL